MQVKAKGSEGVEWIPISQDGKMADLCEHGKNLSICIKYEKSLN
jgi:hypothetical protein